MDRKHGRSADDGTQPCHEELRPSKHARQERPKLADATKIAYDPTSEQLKTIYGKLLEAGQARILVLRAGHPSDEIECELMQETLPTQGSFNNTLAYEALSYVWGGTENRERITLCGSPFPVTQNLAEALRHLRLPDRDRPLWADAICINQYDKKEKEIQVRSMYRIYRLAQRVIAWLGIEDNASNQAFCLMSMISGLPGENLASAIAIQIDKEGGDQKNVVRQFMERPYWSRAWIVQEMMAARSLFIQCGSELVPYAALENLYPPGKPAFSMVPSTWSKFDPFQFQFHNSLEQKILRISSEHFSCKSFLDYFLDRECLYRHDSIYAFLNLFDDDIRQKIQVCYEDDIHELVRTISRAMIESMQSLYIIVIRGRQKVPEARDAPGDVWQVDMPSWCPYFATPYKSYPVGTQHGPSLFAEKARFAFGHDSIQVKGFVIGRVCRTVSRLGLRRDKARDRWDQRDMDEEWKYFLRCLCLGSIERRRDGLKGLRKAIMSIEATTRTLLAGQAQRISGFEMLQNSWIGHVEGQTMATLRDIWNIGASRSVCAFRLGREARRALSFNSTPGCQSINCVALVPDTVRLGDVICTIIGCPTPVVIRRIGAGYHVLGEGYIDTIALGNFDVTVMLRDFWLR